MNLIRLIRYRFFLFAGLIPYFLGQAAAFEVRGGLNRPIFWLGFAGIFFVLIAVELFNEYFDAKEGGDRIFSQEQPRIPEWFYKLGISALAIAFLIGVYLALQTGWVVLLFSFAGFLAAYFYVGPPIRWAYRGMGELVIALSYGPVMLLGSYYLQVKSIGFVPLFVSLVCGLSMFSLAILNEIPDYYQDMLVGKKNLVVRLGKQKAIILLKVCLSGVFILLVSGILLKTISLLAATALITIPFIFMSIRKVEKDRGNPETFRYAVNTVVVAHIVITLFLGLSFLRGNV